MVITKIGLYVITDSRFGWSHEELVEMSLKAGVRFIQFREKKLPTRRMYEIAKRIREITKEYSATFIVNDRVDLAISVDADGVHIGQDDLPIEVVRDIFDGLIGVSTHSVEEAKRSERFADYISVGPVFKTKTKEDAKDPVGVETLRDVVKSVSKPVVAIGSINRHNIVDVLKTGVSGVAVISAIANSKDPERSARELLEIISRWNL
jgi:thiamine-phosphate pyrophosphorylase